MTSVDGSAHVSTLAGGASAPCGDSTSTTVRPVECRDSLPASRGRTTAAPHTVSALLRESQATGLPVTQLRVVIAEWLAINRPTAQLVISLRANGFGFLLEGVVARRPRPAVCHRPAPAHSAQR